MAAAERQEDAGNRVYHDDHMGTIFDEGFSFSGYERDLLSWNTGDGFLDISGVSGVDSISDGRGASFADLDNDGDHDIFLTTEQGEAHFLFRNNVGNERNWLRVELVGDAAGRDAFGSVVRLEGEAGPQIKLKAGGSGYLSQSDPRLLFGLGAAEQARAVEVVWSDGTRQVVGDVPAGRTIRVTQGQPDYETIDPPRFALADPLDPDEVFLTRLGFEKGQPFPQLPLTARDGSTGALPGKGMRLVNLWATWCVPCAKEIPELQALQGKLAAAGVTLAGVSVDAPETVGMVEGYLADRNVSYPTFTTDERGLEALYPSGEVTVSVTVLLDADGTVVEVFSGWSARTERRILALAR